MQDLGALSERTREQHCDDKPALEAWDQSAGLTAAATATAACMAAGGGGIANHQSASSSSSSAASCNYVELVCAAGNIRECVGVVQELVKTSVQVQHRDTAARAALPAHHPMQHTMHQRFPAHMHHPLHYVAY